MKIFFSYLILFILLNNIYGEELKNRIDDPLEIELTETNIWICAIPGIIDQLNHHSHITLEPEIITNQSRESMKKFIIPSWNIYKREDLLNMLNWVLTKGQRAEFNEYLNYIENNKALSIDEICMQYNLTDRAKRGMEYIKTLDFKKDEKTLLGYDLGRYVALCKWGYQAGYINNIEAWEKIYSIIPLIKENYNSWEEFGNSYLLGRLFWLELSNDLEIRKTNTIKVYKKLLTPPDGIWTKIPWNSEKGDISFCQYCIGQMYLNGYGTKQNTEKAIFWFEKASISGSIDAKNILINLKN
jgi:hypothetical protein